MEKALLIIAALVILVLSAKAFFSPPKTNVYGTQLNPARQKVFGKIFGSLGAVVALGGLYFMLFK
ncbi:hypothetical protein [Saccharibacillus sacchari]|uniref:Uncharacterized protein n=1 Tax=Saccharibacillus sacchari TaxID=456493 RepID=A0ACC6P7J2_9BACL